MILLTTRFLKDFLHKKKKTIFTNCGLSIFMVSLAKNQENVSNISD